MGPKSLSIVAALIITFCAQPRVSAQTEKRLDYRQEKELKDAISYLDQAEGQIQQIDERIKKMQVGDASVPIEEVRSLIAGKDKTAQYLTYAEDRIKLLPATHSKVKPEAERLATLKTALAVSEKKLNDLNAGLTKVVEQGGGAGYKADFDRLKEINQMYGNPQILEGQPLVAIEVVKQMSAVKAERARIAEKYADLLKQTTTEARNMNGVLRHFDEVFGRFEQATQAYASAAPGPRIEQDIKDAMTMADDAVKNGKPLFFGEEGGVRQRLSWAETRCNVLAAIAPDAATTATSKQSLDAAREKVKQMKASLNDAIIESNTPPEERYNGPDKAQLVELVKQKWAASGVASPVLKVGINSQSWQRSTRWEWNRSNAWEKVDKSFIQGHVIVKQDDKLAVIHYINLVKDHLANDQITAHFFEDPKAEPDVSRKMMVAKVK